PRHRRTGRAQHSLASRTALRRRQRRHHAAGVRRQHRSLGGGQLGPAHGRHRSAVLLRARYADINSVGDGSETAVAQNPVAAGEIGPQRRPPCRLIRGSLHTAVALGNRIYRGQVARRAVRGATLSMASIPAGQGQEPVSRDLPGERARGLDGGVEHGREILPPERRFVLRPSRRHEINSWRTQEFLASFGQFVRIFMQLIVATVRLPILTQAPRAVACFGFVPHSLAEALEVLPIIPRGRCRSCNSVSPQNVAKKIDHAIRTPFRNPPILASEDRAQYEDLKRLVLSDIKPRGLQEARDIVEAEWEVCRLRWMKVATLHAVL